MDPISRRHFLRGAGAFGAAAVAGTAGLVGCAKEGGEGEGGTQPTSVPASDKFAYAVHEADIIIVGSGISGLFAAWRALKEGKKVTILDKGRYGHSGNSGMNWGNMFSASEFYGPASDELVAGVVAGMANSGDGLIDQRIYGNIVRANAEACPAITAEQLGNILTRGADGLPNHLTGGAVEGFMPRFFAQKVKRLGAEIHDRTFVTSLLFTPDKAHIAGVAAIDLRDGSCHVYRGKAVIMATGSYVWASGWNGMRAHTHGSADLTGEGLAMLLNAGIPMADCEIQEQDQTQYEPLAVRNTVYTMGIQVTGVTRAFNNNMELFALPAAMAGALAQGPFMRLTMREIHEGRGTEHGGIWADTTDMASVEKFWRRTKEDLYRNLGYEVPDMAEMTPHFWACGMRPYTLSDTCETLIPGLFYAGEAPAVFTGGSTNACVGTGWMSGAGAAKISGEIELPVVDWDSANDVFAKAFVSMKAEGEGLRPFDVMRMVQDAFWKDLGLIRNEEGINNAIAELQRIKDEVLPKMVCPDKSLCLNNEWRTAMEVPGMLDCCLACGHAALMRKQSRGGTFCRTDYPELGDSLYNTITTFDGSNWTTETKKIVDIYISEADLLATMPRVSFAHGVEA